MLTLGGGTGYVLSTGIGQPRTWCMTRTAAFEGYQKGLAQGEADPNMSAKERVRLAMREARARVALRVNALIEREIPDAALGAIHVIEGTGHLINAGAVRTYLWRRGEHKRVSPKEEGRAGLLETAPAHARIPLEPGDLLMMGSSSAFSAQAVAKIATVLQADPETPVSVLATLMTEPARNIGAGGASVVVRVK